MILGWFEGPRLEIMKWLRTDKQTEFQLVDSTPPVGGVEWKQTDTHTEKNRDSSTSWSWAGAASEVLHLLPPTSLLPPSLSSLPPELRQAGEIERARVWSGSLALHQNCGLIYIASISEKQSVSQDQQDQQHVQGDQRGKRGRCEKLWRGNFCSWQQVKIDCNL